MVTTLTVATANYKDYHIDAGMELMAQMARGQNE
jgi:hypothetical protein